MRGGGLAGDGVGEAPRVVTTNDDGDGCESARGEGVVFKPAGWLVSGGRDGEGDFPQG